MKVIADSSFLIALAMIDALPLLSRIFSEVFIPEAVYEEVVVRGADLALSESRACAAWKGEKACLQLACDRGDRDLRS